MMEKVTVYSVFIVVAYAFVSTMGSGDSSLARMFEAELPSVFYEL
jgi:hypothetical protein